MIKSCIHIAVNIPAHSQPAIWPPLTLSMAAPCSVFTSSAARSRRRRSPSLAARAARDGDRRRLLRAAELVKTLQGAAMLNVNGGQIAGWLCAGMFTAM